MRTRSKRIPRFNSSIRFGFFLTGLAILPPSVSAFVAYLVDRYFRMELWSIENDKVLFLFFAKVLFASPVATLLAALLMVWLFKNPQFRFHIQISGILATLVTFVPPTILFLTPWLQQKTLIEDFFMSILVSPEGHIAYWCVWYFIARTYARVELARAA